MATGLQCRLWLLQDAVYALADWHLVSGTGGHAFYSGGTEPKTVFFTSGINSDVRQGSVCQDERFPQQSYTAHCKAETFVLFLKLNWAHLHWVEIMATTVIESNKMLVVNNGDELFKKF